MELNSFLEAIKVGSRQDLLDTLANVSSFDNDFNGENGEEYLWEEANGLGYDSNLDYILSKVQDIKDDTEVIETFFNEWMERDSFYDGYEVNVLTNKKKQVYAFSFVVIRED